MKKSKTLFLLVALALIVFAAPSFADSVDKATDAMQEGQDAKSMMDKGQDAKGMMDKGQDAMDKGQDMMDKGQGAMDQGKDMMDIKNPAAMEVTVTCVQADEGGELQSLTEFEVCTGTMVAVSADKSAAVVAPKADSAAMKGGKQSVEGVLDGHTRGYVLASSSALGDSGATQSVSGALVCLLPNYEDGTVQPIVGTSPCGEKDQHLHVVHTADGQVYALHGSEESIKNLEASSDRENVSLEGKVLGDQGAWVLYVN